MKKYVSSSGEEDGSEESILVVILEDFLAKLAGPRTGSTVKADTDGVNEAQAAAKRNVFPFALLFPFFPLARKGMMFSLYEAFRLMEKIELWWQQTRWVR